MADMFVHSLVENLKELMKSEHPIIGSKRNQATLRFLHANVCVMSNFLKRTELEKCSADEEVKRLLTEIRDVTYEVENYVDTFVQEAIVAGQEHASSSTWLNAKLEKVRIGLRYMRSKLHQSKLTLKKKVMAARYRSADDGQKVNSETVVGIEDTMDKLLSRLTDGSKSMEVISIVGSPGIGKSTVAQRVFDHGRIKSSFPIRAWSTVSQSYDIKRLLIDILQSSSLFEDGDGDYSVDELGEELLKRLKGKRYLVVLDDMWGIEPWNDIQRSFLDQHNGSRVLFTSRFAAIGKDVYDDINTHHMRGLSEEHSWNLLKNKVFRQGQCPPELEEYGMEIVRKCVGLPLAIVVTGGLLAKKDKKPEFWEQVASNLAPAIATDPEASFMNTLELSYRHLPVHLKACFLHLGSFPLEYNHSLRELIWLLIAEGFVIQENDEKSLEVTAEGYLNELVEWSLVIVDRKKSCGAIKVVRIHDFLRVFCVTRGNQELIHLKCKQRIYRLFRLNYRPSNVLSFCSEVLTRDKYLSLSSTKFALSPKLLNLETLVVTDEYVLDLPDDVWNMVKLRHLYNKNGRFHFQACPPQGAVLGNLQTLHTLCACDSCLTMLVRTPNIRKLGLSGYIGDLNLCFLKQVETLKVAGPILSWKEVWWTNLELPASLRKLTLEGTFLRWENISFLEQLPNLEVLKLLVNAFSSKKTDAYWDTSEVDFSKLKYLKMKGLDIVKWEDQDLQFESMEVLVLDKCFQLETIPFDLAGCPSLQTIDVRGCPTLVGELAKEIEVEHENMYGNSNLQVFITDPYVFLES